MLTKKTIHHAIILSRTINTVFCPTIPKFMFTNKNISPLLKTYQRIKSKQVKNNSQTDIQQYSDSKIENQNLMNVRCRGCNSYLQSVDMNKYGYIDKKVLNEAIQYNAKNISKIYEDKVRTKQSKILDFMHEVQKQSGISIFNQSTGAMENLNNLQVLMRLEEKIDKYEEQEQLAKRSKKDRKDVLCFRCFSLKHHNRLPQQYDNREGFTTDSRQFILNKIFNRHKNNEKNPTHFFLVVDVFDILGSMPENLVHRLLAEKVTFSIITNKMDLVHKKYLQENLIHSTMKKSLTKLIKSYIVAHQEEITQSQEKELVSLVQNVKIFYLSSVSFDGFKKLKQYISEIKGNVQLIGLPNTGKTTIINGLSKAMKSTSKVPGTTIKITEHEYGRGATRKLYDMPGLYYPHLMYNLITKPSLMTLLTWQKKIAPGIFTHQVFIYGGKIEIQGVRIIVYGLGGACSSSNRWFLSNFSEFWKGLPSPNQLKIKKYEHDIEFINGIADDLEISGYGFIGFRLCQPEIKKINKKLIFYLPEQIEFRFRPTIFTNDQSTFHNKSGFTKQFLLERLHVRPKVQKKEKKKIEDGSLKNQRKKLLENKQDRQYLRKPEIIAVEGLDENDSQQDLNDGTLDQDDFEQID